MNKFVKYSTMACAILAAAGTAQAIPTLIISDGNPADTVVVADNTAAGGSGISATGAALTTTAADANSTLGAVLFSGSIGSWSLVVDIGQTTPLVGSATKPELDLNFTATAGTTTAGTLTVQFVDNGFTSTAGYTQAIGGTAGVGSTVTGTVLKNGTGIGGVGPFAAGAFSATSGGSVSLGSSDVLGLQIAIQGGTSGDTTTGDYKLTVPDGGMTLMLLGSALSSLALLKKKLF
jgi:hypothetical protein